MRFAHGPHALKQASFGNRLRRFPQDACFKACADASPLYGNVFLNFSKNPKFSSTDSVHGIRAWVLGLHRSRAAARIGIAASAPGPSETRPYGTRAGSRCGVRKVSGNVRLFFCNRSSTRKNGPEASALHCSIAGETRWNPVCVPARPHSAVAGAASFALLCIKR